MNTAEEADVIGLRNQISELSIVTDLKRLIVKESKQTKMTPEMRMITDKTNVMITADKMNEFTKTYAVNTTKMAKERTMFADRMIVAIICKEGNLTCYDQIEVLQKHCSLSCSDTGNSLIHDSIETNITVKCFECGSNHVEDDPVWKRSKKKRYDIPGYPMYKHTTDSCWEDPKSWEDPTTNSNTESCCIEIVV